MGSRQQSRFIAMMDGYDRTLELVEIAQDSEGQSAAQFLKTLDSLDSKLSKVSNSFEQLYQKFVDSDFFSGLLNGLNNFLQELGNLDASSIAIYAAAGLAIGNSIIQGIQGAIKNGAPALTQLINNNLNNVKNKMVEKAKGTEGGFFNVVSGRSKEIKQSKEDFLKQKYKQTITINSNINEKTAELDKLKSKLEALNGERAQIEVDLKQEGLDSQTEFNLTAQLGNKDAEINNTVEAIQNTTEEVNELSQSLSEVSNIEFELPEITPEQKQRFSQSIANTALTAGPALVTALSVGITTAINSDNPFEGIGSGMLSYLGMIAPTLISNTIQLATQMGTSFGTAFVTAGGPYIVAIGVIIAAILGIIALVTNAIKNSKTEAQKLQEDIEKLEKQQSELDEKAEKSTAEYSVSKTATKRLNKLVETYDELSKKTNRTTEDNEKLNSTIESLGQDFPDLIKGYDEAGNAVLKQRDTWNEIIEKQKESTRLALVQANKDKLNADINTYQTAKKQKELSDISASEYFRKGIFSGSGIGRDIGYSSTDINKYISQNDKKIIQLLSTWSDYQSDKYIDPITALFYDGQAGIKNEIIPEDFEKLLKDIEGTDDLNEQRNKFIEYFHGKLEADEELVTNIANSMDNELKTFVQQIKNVDNTYNDSNEFTQKANETLQQIFEDLSEGIVNTIDLNNSESKKYSDFLKTKISKNLVKKNEKSQQIANLNIENLKELDNFKQLRNMVIDMPEFKERFKTAFTEDKEYVDENWFKDEKNTGLMQEILDKYKNNFIENTSQKVTELLTSAEKALDEVDFNILNSGDYETQSLDTIKNIQNTLATKGIDTGFIDDSLEEINKKMESWTPPFVDMANKFSFKLSEMFMGEKISDEMANQFNQVFEELPDKTKINGLAEAIMSIDDWGSMDKLKGLAQLFYNAGDNAEKAAEHVLTFANALGSAAQIDITTADFDQYFTELGGKVQDAAKDFKDLYSAMEEYKEMGRLSAQTIIDLVAAGKIEYLMLDENTNSLKLNTQAIEENWHEKMKEATESLDMQIAEQEAAQAGLKLQISVEKRKLEILKEAKKKGGVITATELNELRKLENTYAIDITNGQIDTNSEIITQNIDLFKSLYADSDIGFQKLVEQAVYYGEKIKNGLATGIKQDLSDKNPYADILSSWGDKETRKAFSSTALQMPDSDIYVFNIKELDAEIASIEQVIEGMEKTAENREETIKQLTEIRDKIKAITTDSSFTDYMKDTGKATKDSNKELEDYISTLEKYYNLQKKLSVQDNELEKARKKWEETGSQEDFEDYQNKFTAAAQTHAKVKATYINERGLDLEQLQTGMGKYGFTEEGLKKYGKTMADVFKLDEYGYLDMKPITEVLAKMAADGTLDAETGQKAENFLKGKQGEIEQDTDTIREQDDWFDTQIKNQEETIKKLDEAEKSFDRLKNIEQALNSIKKIVDDAKKANEDYYNSGGREGLSGMEYLRVLGQNQETTKYANEQLNKYREEKNQELIDQDLKKYTTEGADGKLYITTVEGIGLGTEAGDARYKELERLVNIYNETTDKIDDNTRAIKDQAREIKKWAQGLRSSYSSLVNRIAEGLRELDQRQIDAVKKRYEMIQEEDNKYLQSLQKSIEKQRQLRDQAKSYDDLEKDEKRLALLERDTSGANAVEIAALKEQVKNSRQNLVDTEQDNIVNRISDENEKRKERMDQETAFLQNVMDERTFDMQYYIEKAYDIVNGAIDGAEGAYEQMLDILQQTEEAFYKGTAEDKEEWLEKLQETYKQGEDWRTLELNGLKTFATGTTEEISKVLEKYVKDNDEYKTSYSETIGKLEEVMNNLDIHSEFENARAAAQEALDKIKEVWDTFTAQGDLEKEIVYKVTVEGAEQLNSLSGGNLNPMDDNNKSGFVAFKTDNSGRTIVTGTYESEDIAKKATAGTGGNYKAVDDISQFISGNELTDKQKLQMENYNKTYGTLDWNNQKEVKAGDFLKDKIQLDKYYGIAKDGYTIVGPYNSQYGYNPNSTQMGVENAPKELKTGEEIKKELLKIADTGEKVYGEFLDDELIRILNNKLLRIIPVKYAKGGLVDYTGPAWVDGTKSSPEAFLSAEDTRNIEALTQILQQAFANVSVPSTSSKIAEKAGDTHIEIHIDIDKMSSDYDVEQMLDTIQSRISEASEGQVTIVR